MRAGLRASLAREHAFLVSVDSGDARPGGEVGEIPDVLADHLVDTVEDAVVHGQDVDLELFAPRLARHAVQPRLRVGAARPEQACGRRVRPDPSRRAGSWTKVRDRRSARTMAV